MVSHGEDLIIKMLRDIHSDIKTAKVSNSAVMPGSTDVIAALYNELLMAVSRKFPGESRHETALRYIRETEAQANYPGKACKSL